VEFVAQPVQIALNLSTLHAGRLGESIDGRVALAEQAVVLGEAAQKRRGGRHAHGGLLSRACGFSAARCGRMRIFPSFHIAEPNMQSASPLVAAILIGAVMISAAIFLRPLTGRYQFRPTGVDPDQVHVIDTTTGQVRLFKVVDRF